MIAVIGGGICGLSIGWYLARSGQEVTLFERGQVGRGATWAAAGTLGPWSSPDSDKERAFPLHLSSYNLWPEFARELEAASGMAIDYRTEGRLFIILDHEGIDRLKERYERNATLGLPVEWLSGSAVRRLEPNLAPSVTNGIFTPTAHTVDNRLAALALRQAFLKAGGTLREETSVQSVLTEAGHVRGVQLSDETVAAETVILAAGAWSTQLEGVSDTILPAVRPVKGQAFAVQMPPDKAPLLRHVVTGPLNMVPRSDGRLVFAGTQEDGIFDTDVTAGALLDMLSQAQRMLPAITHLPIAETWAGLRPASADDLPVLGPTSIKGLSVATGHYRNGILLAPITAQSICNLTLTGQVMNEIKDFTPQRFR